MPESYRKIESSKYPFDKILSSIFKVKNLRKLHIDENLDAFIKADLGKDSNSKFHKLFYDEIKRKDSELRKYWENNAEILKKYWGKY